MKYWLVFSFTILLTLLLILAFGEPVKKLFSKEFSSNDSITTQLLKHAINRDDLTFRTWIQNQFDVKQHQDFNQVIDYFLWVYHVWNYQPDPEIEVFQSPLESIQRNFYGDCDDYSILMAVGLKHMGYKTRIVLTSHHAYPELFWYGKPESVLSTIQHRFPNEKIELNIIKENHGFWLPLDYVAPYPGAMPLLNGEIEQRLEL